MDGLDVAFHNDQGKIAETPYRERTTFKPFGPVDNGPQCPVRPRLPDRSVEGGGGQPLPHRSRLLDVGRIEHQVMRCFLIPRASALIAGATVAPDATSFKLESVLGSNTYGILSNKYLDEIAKTTRFDVTVTIGADTFSYDETTVVEHQKHPTIIMHTDRNTLRRVSWEA